MLPITGIDHIVLRVRDLDTMLTFYQGVLGCSLERQEMDLGLYQLRAGSALIDLVSVDSPLGKLGGRPPEQEGQNLDHFCLRIDPFDADTVKDYLLKHQVKVGEIASRYGALGRGISIYLGDPEGNKLELKGEL